MESIQSFYQDIKQQRISGFLKLSIKLTTISRDTKLIWQLRGTYNRKEWIVRIFPPIIRFISIRLFFIRLHQLLIWILNYFKQMKRLFFSQWRIRKKKKPICGLEQSFIQWYIRFHNIVVPYDFTVIIEDHYKYTKKIQK